MKLSGKKVLIGVTGGIAAYKIPILVRELIKEGAQVQVILTPDAQAFVTPLTLATVSNNPVHTVFFNKTTGEWDSHIHLALWADIFLIAPTTANTLAKMAHGLADNLLLAVYLSARCKCVVAPAMDLDMLKHPSTEKNIRTLEKQGVEIIPSETGFLASGLIGEGRMPEPETLCKYIIETLNPPSILSNQSWVVTAGPTFESIDPVRFIGNHSSGKMGIAIAETLAAKGAQVILICGPSSVPHRHQDGIQRIDITSADEMLEAVESYFVKADGMIMAAAVADYKPKIFHKEKLKKSGENLILELTPNPDILSRMGEKKNDHQLVIGFALESSNGINHAKEKLKKKNLDAIILNSLEDDGAGFGGDTNRITIIDKEEEIITFPLKSKADVANDIISFIESVFHKKIS